MWLKKVIVQTLLLKEEGPNQICWSGVTPISGPEEVQADGIMGNDMPKKKFLNKKVTNL